MLAFIFQEILLRSSQDEDSTVVQHLVRYLRLVAVR